MAQIETTTWDVYSPLPFSTSVLHPLVPLGVGTPYVESLTSYLKRLAYAHYLKVADLVTFCSTQTDSHVLPSTLQKLSRIDGMTDGGQIWAALLQKLTGQEEVGYLTMHYWRSLLNPYRMLRQHHAWCPQCFAEAAQQEIPLYEPLAWRLQSVETCDIHGCSLAETCPGCGRQFTTLSNRAVVGYCPKCQYWLGNSAPNKPSRSSEEVVKRAKSVGRLLAFASQTNPVRGNRMAQILPLLKQQHRTTHTYLVRVMRTSTSVFSLLLTGGHQPNLGMFSRLATYSGEPFWQALTQSTDATRTVSTQPENKDPQTYLDRLLTSSQRSPSLHTIARHCGFDTVVTFRKAFPTSYDALWQRIHAEQRQVLEQALQQETPVVLSKWAEQHGYRTGDLYDRFHDLCLQVTQRYQSDKRERCRLYLENVLQGQSFPTFSEISTALGVGDHYLKQHFSDELQVIEAERQQQFEHTKALARKYLDQVIAEDEGGVSLEQVAQAVGKSTRYLKNNFPAQSHLLLRRRHAHIAKQVQATCDCIRQTVFDLHQQGIFPSVDRIHAVIDSWMVHGKAYRHAYNEAMTLCGYHTISTP